MWDAKSLGITSLTIDEGQNILSHLIKEIAASTLDDYFSIYPPIAPVCGTSAAAHL